MIESLLHQFITDTKQYTRTQMTDLTDLIDTSYMKRLKNFNISTILQFHPTTKRFSLLHKEAWSSKFA